VNKTRGTKELRNFKIVFMFDDRSCSDGLRLDSAAADRLTVRAAAFVIP